MMAKLKMSDTISAADKALGDDKRKSTFLTNLLITKRYESMTGMTGLYEIFEPERVAWWNSVCRTFSDEVQRIQLH